MSKTSLQLTVRHHEMELVPCLTKSVGVVGSRSLPYSLADKVGLITEDLIKRKYHIATGGAIGADQFVIERLAVKARLVRPLHRVQPMAKLRWFFRQSPCHDASVQRLRRAPVVG